MMLIASGKKTKTTVFWQSTLILVLIFLAISRWIPGSDPLSPETGSRGWIEVGFLILSFLVLLIIWGVLKLALIFKSPSFVILFAFCLWAMVTSIWSPNHLVSLGKAGSLLIMTIVMAVIALQMVRYDVPIVEMLLTAMMLFVFFLFLINIFVINSLFQIDWSAARPRLTLGFNHPNTTASFFSTIIFCSIVLIRRNTRWKKKLLYTAIICVSSILLYFTNSRTTMISLIICVSLYLVIQIASVRIRVILLSIGGILASLLIAIFIMSYYDAGLLERLGIDLNLNSVFGRLQLWGLVFQNMPQINLGGLGYYASRFYLLPDIAWGYHTHNTYLEVLSTTGIVGVFLMLFFYLSTYSTIRRYKVFPLAIIFLIYASLESIMELRLFDPSILMGITGLLIFYQQFKLQHSSLKISQKVMKVELHEPV